MRSGKLLLLLIVSMVMGGCASFSLPMLHPVSPLQEQLLEGEGKAKLLILDISGVITEREKSGALKEKPSMVSEIKEALQKAEKDEDLAGVIVRINSPGGTVTASDIIHHELSGFKSRKKVPVYASIMGLGTSGGYYVAAATDLIAAHPTAVTGSIGVLFMRFQLDGLLGKIGVAERTVKSGDKKDMLSPFRGSTPEEERIMQEVIGELHGRFVNVILARPGNKLERAELEALADGRIYTADQALKHKLIDRVGYLDEIMAELKKAAGLDKARIVSYYRPGSFKGSIYAGGADDTSRFGSLIAISGEELDLLPSTGFAYLWKP